MQPATEIGLDGSPVVTTELPLNFPLNLCPPWRATDERNSSEHGSNDQSASNLSPDTPEKVHAESLADARVVMS